ncbi:MAG: hypothetical protein AMJ73_07505 [candidate division Zixibacteria bacterium SM1_73]|nr:MAG: hypothetical protein AMJ73_07505 [candidate division Zixibacteria bacterium SM1_73]
MTTSKPLLKAGVLHPPFHFTSPGSIGLVKNANGKQGSALRGMLSQKGLRDPAVFPPKDGARPGRVDDNIQPRSGKGTQGGLWFDQLAHNRGFFLDFFYF